MLSALHLEQHVAPSHLHFLRRHRSQALPTRLRARIGPSIVNISVAGKRGLIVGNSFGGGIAREGTNNTTWPVEWMLLEELDETLV